jgi:hypothetical protein
MRTSLSLLALPALVLAADPPQIPLLDTLRGWFDKAAALIPTSIPIPDASIHIPNPLDAGAAKVAGLVVHPLNRTNWHDVLEPAGPSITGTSYDWLVYVTGDTSCYGLCKNVTKAWNTSTAILSASPNHPNLASIDCDSFSGGYLCSLWDVKPPSIYHLSFPASGELTPTIRFIPLNHTSVTAASLSGIHTAKAYQLTEPYEGIWHPWTGFLAKYHLAEPVAWLMFGMSKLPSWAPMIIVSLLSRTMMKPAIERRLAGRGAAAPPAAAPAVPKA